MFKEYFSSHTPGDASFDSSQSRSKRGLNADLSWAQRRRDPLEQLPLGQGAWHQSIDRRSGLANSLEVPRLAALSDVSRGQP
jgi:hypothetical protein